MMNGKELTTWDKLPHVTINDHLRIKDIINLECGETIDIACFDRNYGDFHYDRNIEEALPGDIYVKPGYHIRFTKTNDIYGSAVFYWGNKDGSYFEDEELALYEFDIEFKLNNWYPLSDGKLQSEHLGEFNGKMWNEFDENTRIGWRGPCVLLKSLNKWMVK